MALVVLDASVVIAQLDLDDELHAAAERAFESRLAEDLLLPLTALSECLVGPAAGGRLARAREDIAALGIAIDVPDEPVAMRAAALRATTPVLRLPDALVLASGYERDADEILTAD